jgi:hypothetical protein
MPIIVQSTIVQIANTYTNALRLQDGSLMVNNSRSGISVALDRMDHVSKSIRSSAIAGDTDKWDDYERSLYTHVSAADALGMEPSRVDVASAQRARAAKLAEEIMFTSGKRYMYSAWGYDQTNVTWYEIEKVTAKSVRLVEVASQQFDLNPADPQAGGLAIPKPGSRRGKPFTRKRQAAEWVRVSEYQIAHNWDGRPRSYTCGG